MTTGYIKKLLTVLFISALAALTCAVSISADSTPITVEGSGGGLS